MTTEAQQVEAAVDAVHVTYRREVAQLKLQLAAYRKALLDNGIEPPDMGADDLVKLMHECREVVSSACAVAVRFGTEKELMVEW